MKQTDFIGLLEVNGWYLKRRGANHDIYTDGTNIEPIPRHQMIKKPLVDAIIKRRGPK